MSQGNIKITELQLSNDKLLPEVVRLLNEGHTVTLRLRGYSMRPFLEDGRDKALLTKPSVVKVGDPVLAEISKGRYVLHRVVAIDNNKVTLRGDGNLGIEKCTINDIKGAVIGFYRKGVVQLELRFRIIQIQAGQRNDFLPPIGQRIAVQEKLCGCQVLVEAVFNIAA